MRLSIGLVVLVLVATACSSYPTESDQYAELEQELAAVTQERDALASQPAIAVDTPDRTEIPPGVDQLIDEWWAALERGDNSVLDLYLPSGYHLYGDARFRGEDLVNHLAGSSNYSSEWITPTFVAANEGDGTYVVVRGIRNTQISSGLSWASAFAFEIETVEDSSLMIAHTAFIFRRD